MDNLYLAAADVLKKLSLKKDVGIKSVSLAAAFLFSPITSRPVQH
jgi:hypothetical protein